MSSQSTFYDRLLLLPLFQGIALSDFYEIAQRVPLNFETFDPGDYLVHAGDACAQLRFVMGGEVRVVRERSGEHYRLSEWINRPMAIQPHHLFGLNPRFTRSYIAETEVQTIAIDKSAVRDILFNYTTFRINYLNFLSRQVEQMSASLWLRPSRSLIERFRLFLLHRCIRPAGQKLLGIKMTDLAEELLTTRLNVSQMLAWLENLGLLTARRESILIPSLEALTEVPSPSPRSSIS